MVDVVVQAASGRRTWSKSTETSDEFETIRRQRADIVSTQLKSPEEFRLPSASGEGTSPYTYAARGQGTPIIMTEEQLMRLLRRTSMNASVVDTPRVSTVADVIDPSSMNTEQADGASIHQSRRPSTELWGQRQPRVRWRTNSTTATTSSMMPGRRSQGQDQGRGPRHLEDRLHATLELARRRTATRETV